MKRRDFIGLVSALPVINWFVPKIEAKERTIQATYHYTCTEKWVEDVYAPAIHQVVGNFFRLPCWSYSLLSDLYRDSPKFQHLAGKLFQEIPDTFVLTDIDLQDEKGFYRLYLTGITKDGVQGISKALHDTYSCNGVWRDRGAKLAEVNFGEV